MMMTTTRQKKQALKNLIDSEQIKNAFVFCNRKKDVDLLGKWFRDHGYSAAALHGDMIQSKRTETLQAFKDGKIVLLVCSDVAARGLDVSGVSHVFNYDVPFNADDYVHRIGRTGRAGASGRAWTLVTDDDENLVAAIKKLVGRDIPFEGAVAPVQEAETSEQPVARAKKHLAALPPKRKPKICRICHAARSHHHPNLHRVRQSVLFRKMWMKAKGLAVAIYRLSCAARVSTFFGL